MTSIDPMTPTELQSRRKMSITIGLILAFLVVAFYAVTLVRLQGNMVKRAELDAASSAAATQKSLPTKINTGQGK